jgi:methionine aminopeptidase
VIPWAAWAWVIQWAANPLCSGVISWRRHSVAPMVEWNINVLLWSVKSNLRSTNHFVTRSRSTLRFRLHRGVPNDECDQVCDAVYLAQRTQRTRRNPDICTAAACCVSINHSMQGACTRSVESLCMSYDECLPMHDAVYLAQRTQRTRRNPDICTAAACCVSINHSMQGACTRSVESPC